MIGLCTMHTWYGSVHSSLIKWDWTSREKLLNHRQVSHAMLGFVVMWYACELWVLRWRP